VLDVHPRPYIVKTLMEFLVERVGFEWMEEEWSFDSCLPFVASLRLVVCFGCSVVPPHLCPLPHRFCPSVFLYLSSIVPAIWLLELDKVAKRVANMTSTNTTVYSPSNFTIPGGGNTTGFLISTNSSVPPVATLLGQAGVTLSVTPDTWTTLIEQFLMLILIVGRWLLPKGDLTRDQLSQLLLVYIGTAADIIEFFDSYKDDSIARIGFLVYLTLGIWSWSLMQFTIVLSATRGRRPRGSGSHHKEE